MPVGDCTAGAWKSNHVVVQKLTEECVRASCHTQRGSCRKEKGEGGCAGGGPLYKEMPVPSSKICAMERLMRGCPGVMLSQGRPCSIIIIRGAIHSLVQCVRHCQVQTLQPEGRDNVGSCSKPAEMLKSQERGARLPFATVCHPGPLCKGAFIEKRRYGSGDDDVHKDLMSAAVAGSSTTLHL